MSFCLIILAGGISHRFKSNIGKPYQKIGGKSLIDYFNYTNDTAADITNSIHDAGSAVVAVLPYEIAEQKGIEVTLDARSKGFPLQIKVEADSREI